MGGILVNVNKEGGEILGKAWTPYSQSRLMWELYELSDEWAFEVKRGTDRPWDFLMRPVKMDLKPGRKLNSVWDTRLMAAIFYDTHTYIIRKADDFYIAKEPAMDLLIVPDYEVVGKDQRNFPFYKFGSSLIVDQYGLSKYLFGTINEQAVGKAYSWSSGTKYTSPKREKFEGDFSLDDFEACGNKYRKSGELSGVAWYHKHIGVIFGLKALKKLFPDMTTKEARSAYTKFGLTPSTAISKTFEKESKPQKRPPRKQKTEKPEQTGTELDYIISKYDLRPATRGVIMTMGTGDDMVWRTQRELLSKLREAGETITASVVKEIWATLKGRDT